MAAQRPQGDPEHSILNQNSFPPDDWWSPRVGREVVHAMRHVYQTYHINPAPLYASFGSRLSRRGPLPIVGNPLMILIGCLFAASKEERLRQEVEDGVTIALAENPIAEFSEPEAAAPSQPQPQAREVVPFTPAAVAASIPDMHSNPTFARSISDREPLVPSGSARNLAAELERAGAEGGGAGAPASAVKSEPENPFVAVAGQEDASGTDFERSMLQHQRWTQARQSQPASVSNLPGRPVLQNGQSAAVIGEPLPDAQPQPQQATDHPHVATAPEVRVQLSPRAAVFRPAVSSSSQERVQPVSQQAGPPTQALSTPERRPGTIYVSPARPGMSSRDAAELDKAKSFARRHIESLQLRFTLNSYLEDFVQSTEDAFKQHPILDDVDKAGILRPMISSEVKAKLEGDRRLITPTSPEVLYNMLRSRFPCNVAQMELDLSNMHQSADESATDFLDRVRQSHFVNQVRLPEMYSQQLKVITRCTEGFSDRVNADIRMKKTLMRRQGHLHDFPTPWSDLQDLAIEYDRDDTINKQRRRSTRGMSRELRSLKSDDILPSRTRATSKASISSAQEEDRGRSQSRRPFQRRTPENRSSSGAAYRGRTQDKRPTGRPYDRNYSGSYRSQSGGSSRSRDASQAGHTPKATSFKKGSLVSGPSGSRSGRPDTRVQILQPLLNIGLMDVNVIQPLEVAAMPAQAASKPIVVNAIGTPTSDASVNAASTANRRPNKPEGFSQEDMEVALPEAMRRGFREINNLPAGSPYAKILGAQFMITLRQLAGLCLDSDFTVICEQLLELGQTKEQAQRLSAEALSAAQVMQMLCRQLPHHPMPSGAKTVRTQASAIDVPLAPVTQTVEKAIVGMTCITGHLDDAQRHERTLRLDSGAAVSCISKRALSRDAKHLLVHGKTYGLLNGISVSGFDSNHTRVTEVLYDAEIIIGSLACRLTFLVVPGLVCDYMLGQDFIVTYDLCVQHSAARATMQVPAEEYMGTDPMPRTQVIDIFWEGRKATLDLA